MTRSRALDKRRKSFDRLVRIARRVHTYDLRLFNDGAFLHPDSGRKGGHVAKWRGRFSHKAGLHMARVEPLTKLLGGKQVLGRTVTSRLELVPLVREGLPYEALEAIIRKLDLSVDATTKSLQLPKRTLSRRKKSQRLDALQSERVLRLAHVATRATEVLGTEAQARSWLLTENRALGGERPLDLLDTDIGTQVVEDVLVRIEHGVFS